MADFGFATQNCGGGEPIPHSAVTTDFSHGQVRAVLTSNCAQISTYEYWTAWVDIAGVFTAAPTFDVDNPITTIVQDHLNEVHSTCEFQPRDGVCARNGYPFIGSKRGVLHPGQYVHNDGAQLIYTDPYGKLAAQSAPEALPQWITNQGWDTSHCCTGEDVFQIQTFSRGLYIADPQEPPGSAEFSYGLP